MDAARELAQLGERGGQLALGRGHELLGGGGVAAADAALGELELERERDEALLGAVVEVALEPPALRVARRDQPLARRAQLREAGPRLGVQVLVLERDRRGRADGLDQLRILVERRVVHERRDLAAVALDRA